VTVAVGGMEVAVADGVNVGGIAVAVAGSAVVAGPQAVIKSKALVKKIMRGFICPSLFEFQEL
jgi:hypothetical protein